MPSTSVVINQIATRDAADVGQIIGRDEFVELRNISTVTQSVGGWQLVACTATGGEVLLATIAAGTVMQPKGAIAGQFFLVANADGYSAATPADLTYTGVQIDDLGGVLLRDAAGAQIDAVGFLGGLKCTETAPAVAQTPAEDPLNLANSRDANSTDTDNNATDFRKQGRNPRNRFS